LKNKTLTKKSNEHRPQAAEHRFQEANDKSPVQNKVMAREVLHPRTERQRRIRVNEPIIRLASAEDVPLIRQLAVRCYGYTQERLLYDVDSFQQSLNTGKLVSFVITEPKGNIFYHLALKYHTPEVPEMGFAFMDLAYRCAGLSKQVGLTALEYAKAHGADGVFACSVTTHTASQKGMEEIGAFPCGLMMGIAAAGMQSNVPDATDQEKGSTVNQYIPINKAHRTIYLPAWHHGIATDIYGWMDLPRTVALGSGGTFSDSSAKLSVLRLEPDLNVAFILVDAIGQDVATAIDDARRCCQRLAMNAVYVFIPTGTPDAPSLVEECEHMGFFFAGLMPLIHDGEDRIILQWLAQDLDEDRIRMHGDKVRHLCHYVFQERKRVAP
jgi:N-acetylglutamate synthase-like GNAT family acetyltransferase